MEDVRLVASGLQFPEGPVAMPDGSVVLVEIRRATLTKVSPEGEVEVVAELGGGPNGAAIGPDGAVYVCNNGGFKWHDVGGITVPGHQPDDYTGGRIQRVDLSTGAVEDLYTEVDGRPLRGPNDLVFDTAGGFWFTDHGKTRRRDRDLGGVYYARADGSAITEVIHPADAPNGIALSPDGTVLYYAETMVGRVWKRQVVAPGELGEAGPFDPSTLLIGLPGLHLLDSMAVDAEGRVCVATVFGAGITSITPDGAGGGAGAPEGVAGSGGPGSDGADVELLVLPEQFREPFVTNLCFGGADLRTAYITLSGTGRLVAATWPRPGLRLAW